MKHQLKLIIGKGEAGFAIPIVLGVGLIMMLIASIMVVRSQSDRTLATAQSKTNESLAVAEAGVTRVQSFLNNYRYFATKNFPWKSYVTDTNELGCPLSPTHSLYTKAQNWEAEQSLSASNKFKIVSYQVNDPNNPTNGTLVIEGKSLLGGNVNDVKSFSRLQVDIPIQRTPQTSFSDRPPGIWAKNYVAGTNKFVVKTAIDSGCTSSIVDANFSVPPNPAANIVKENPAIKLPKLLEKPATDCPATLPTAPASPCTINLGAPITNGERFPRDSDITNYPYGTSSTGEYIYFIPKGTAVPDRGRSINLVENTDSVIVRPDKKVTLYLEGDLRMTAVSFLGHDCFDYEPATPPTTPIFDGLNNKDKDGDGLFGYEADRHTPKDSGDIVPGCKSTDFKILGGSDTRKIEIGGDKNSVLNAFIFAPNAIGSGLQTGANTIIKGSVWVQEWNPTSPSNNVVLVEASDSVWNDLPEEIRPQNIAPYTAWQRKEIP